VCTGEHPTKLTLSTKSESEKAELYSKLAELIAQLNVSNKRGNKIV
jgi:hypothetical protein